MSVKAIKVVGLASGKETILYPKAFDLNLNLMDYLIKAGFTIASSCSGEGVCRKCVVNEDLVSCQMMVADFLNLNTENSEIRISYL